MVKVKRSHHNPLLYPETSHAWEEVASFNGSILKEESVYNMVYRAVSTEQLFLGIRMQQSTIGLCQSGDGIHFKQRKQILRPDEEWEQFGVEDPRVTKIDDKYYIFYTAISNWPPSHTGIKVAVAVTKDFKKFDKHPVTFFNAKAMVLFPEKINGKYCAILTPHTDLPPSKICIAWFDKLEDIWSEDYWKKWYKDLDSHALPIIQTDMDQVESGAVPVKTRDGWVLVFGYVQNYFGGEERTFRIDTALLDLKDPQKLIGQTTDPLLVPDEEYEIYGTVPNTIFPSGAMIEDDDFIIYYGACDTTVCRATIPVDELIADMKNNPLISPHASSKDSYMFDRYAGNPIISPIKSHKWESKYTFNPGAIYLGRKVHILYRAMGDDDTSVIGYASSEDGKKLDERLKEPIYIPRESFEMKSHPGFSGCEDARLTVIDDTLYMCYTAYDGVNPPRVALTDIKVKDFLAKKWNWSKPILISAPGVDNKDSAIVNEKINGMYAIFHRITPCIWLDYVSDLKFGDNVWLGGRPIMGPRAHYWDSLKIGMGGPPDKTEDGWLIIYHGVSKTDMKYRMGAALLDLENPMKVIARLNRPVLEPDTDYENKGYREGTVFGCGSAIVKDILHIYYGGADQYTAVASMPLKKLLDALKSGK
ncbi:hypothetical protein ACFL1A_03425 [Patescibacteria group bacterium]